MQKRWNQPGSLFVKRKPPKIRPAPLWLRILRRVNPFVFLRRIATLIGAMFMLSILFGLIAGSRVQEGAVHSVPAEMILTLRIENGLQEVVSPAGLFDFQGLTAQLLSVHDIVRALDHAATDPRVKAVVVGLEAGGFEIAPVQEMRAAVKRFRASGKKAYVYSPSYAEAGGGMGAYYLASAFSEIWMQPVGMVEIPGFHAEMPYGRTALEKLGLIPQFYQRKEYKGVMDNFTRDAMPPESREMVQSILDDIANAILADIAADRGIASDTMRGIMDQAAFTDSEAIAAKLVDKLSYSDRIFAGLRQEMKGDPESEDLKIYGMGSYFKNVVHKAQPDESLPMVGLVHAVGNIVPRAKGGGFSEQIIAADRVASAIMRGVRDEKIKAIVLRIDSPGGSPTASETIRRAVERARERGKPVIVSMGAAAGSGGYWIAVDAAHIFALPATLTGSIGVAGGKFVAAPLMERIGVTWDGIKIGANADMNSFTGPFSESGDARMNAIVDNIYAAFTARVASGRGLTPESVEELARGRVWTGNQAHGNGLVDSLGGLSDALDHAAVRAGAADRNGISLVMLPRAKTPFDRIFEFFNVEVMMRRVLSTISVMTGQEIAAMTGVSAYDGLLSNRLE